MGKSLEQVLMCTQGYSLTPAGPPGDLRGLALAALGVLQQGTASVCRRVGYKAVPQTCMTTPGHRESESG